MTTAVHAGFDIRNELLPHLNEDKSLVHREEDPMTDYLASVGSNVFSCYNSRFEVDLNRSREEALSTSRESTWNIPIWASTPPQSALEHSLEQHDQFYQLMRKWLSELVDLHGAVLLIDIHSYNHQREGEGKLAPDEDNPDIDIGATTLDDDIFAQVEEKLTTSLRAPTPEGRQLDIRTNVRYPDGGHWPEWVYKNFSGNVCTLTLEYKKFYMNEWTGQISRPVLADLRAHLREALNNTLPVVKKIARDLSR